ncbi:hypothetical protein [Clostridium puniceum]|nr:hypothetical protein [Clostridium puniceum]
MAEDGYLDNIKHLGNTLEYMKSQAPHYKVIAILLRDKQFVILVS